MPTPHVNQKAVFLNIPYDARFRHLYLAYISGITHLGLVPRATLEISGGERRLDRILSLIQSCCYSIHDLSRVEIDRNPPCSTPRFNMPFELGMTVTWEKMNPGQHTWFVFESWNRRLDKSLSDLKGTDPNIHDGTVKGIMRELCNAFVLRGPQPGVPEMMRSYRLLVRELPEVFNDAGTNDLFQARVFARLCFVARGIAEKTRL